MLSRNNVILTEIEHISIYVLDGAERFMSLFGTDLSTPLEVTIFCHLFYFMLYRLLTVEILTTSPFLLFIGKEAVSFHF